MLIDVSIGLLPHFTCLDALIPRVIEFCVTRRSTVSEPRTSATTTTAFAGVLHGAAFGTHRTDHSRRRACWWGLHVNIGQGHKEKEYNHNNYLHALCLELTFAGLHALKPFMINISVACTSALFIPGTARSATTNSAGLLEYAALSTRHRITDR